MKRIADFRVHLLAAAILSVATLALVAWHVRFQIDGIGASYLIFFVHLPNALCGLGFFLLGGLFSLLYLVKRKPRYDIWASSAIVVGLLACTITLVTGSTWARAAWGHWWVWSDPRLLSVAVTWFFFTGYLLLRWAVPEIDRRARYAAVFAIIACVNVPFVHFSIKLLGSVSHPMDVDLGTPELVTVRVGMASFFLTHLLLMRMLVRLDQAGRLLSECREIIHGT